METANVLERRCYFVPQKGQGRSIEGAHPRGTGRLALGPPVVIVQRTPAAATSGGNIGQGLFV